MSTPELKVDAQRVGLTTGIYVRAKNVADQWDSVDIAELDKESLKAWLKSRGGDNKWAEDTVLILLGHQP